MCVTANWPFLWLGLAFLVFILLRNLFCSHFLWVDLAFLWLGLTFFGFFSDYVWLFLAFLWLCLAFFVSRSVLFWWQQLANRGLFSLGHCLSSSTIPTGVLTKGITTLWFVLWSASGYSLLHERNLELVLKTPVYVYVNDRTWTVWSLLQKVISRSRSVLQVYKYVRFLWP